MHRPNNVRNPTKIGLHHWHGTVHMPQRVKKRRGFNLHAHINLCLGLLYTGVKPTDVVIVKGKPKQCWCSHGTCIGGRPSGCKAGFCVNRESPLDLVGTARGTRSIKCVCPVDVLGDFFGQYWAFDCLHDPSRAP